MFGALVEDCLDEYLLREEPPISVLAAVERCSSSMSIGFGEHSSVNMLEEHY